MMVSRAGQRLGIVGYPIEHSLSPVFQQAALDFHGITARYERWETAPEDLVSRVESLRGDDCLGANVTVPYKQAVLTMVDEVDSLARRIGAVNTIVNRGGRLVGFNTDAFGFRQALEQEGAYTLEEKRVLLIGAGGAARAVAFAMLDAGISNLTIANRRLDRARALAAELADEVQGIPITTVSLGDEWLDVTRNDIDLLVNATLVGTNHTAFEADSPVPARILHRGMMVYDLVYNPAITPLLKAAEDAGADTLNGMPMLVYQGAASFTLWTGKQAPVGLMFERLREALGEGN